MSWEDYYFENLYTEPDEEDSIIEEEPLPYANVNRGLLSDLAHSTIRGVANVADLTASGLEQIGLDNQVDDWIKEKRKSWDILKPDIQDYFGLEGPVERGLKSIPETLITSVGSALPGALAAGAATGYNPTAMGVGAFGNMALTFAAGTYKKAKEEYLEKNPGDEDGAMEYAGIQAASEFGLETLSNATALLTFGGSTLVNVAAKTGGKQLVRNLLSLSAKDLIKAGAITSGTELATELATYGIQASADEAYGMGEGITSSGLVETGVATIGMSLLFGGAGVRYNYKEKQRLKDQLQSDSKLAQVSAANTIRVELEKSGDVDLAQAWKVYTDNYINTDRPIPLSEDFVEVAERVKQAQKVNVKSLLSNDPAAQKEAADVILAENGIDLDGSFIDSYAPAGDQQAISLAYNRARNKGTGNQDIAKMQEEQLKAEIDEALRPSAPARDPVQVLEGQYFKQEANKAKEVIEENQKAEQEKILDKLRASILRYNQTRNKLLVEKREGISTTGTPLSGLTPEEAAKLPKKFDTPDFVLSQKDQVELNMLYHMLEVEPDSNNLRPEAIARMQELEAKALEQAKQVATKGIKGSKRVAQAKTIVKKIEAKQTKTAQQQQQQAPQQPLQQQVPVQPIPTPALTEEEQENSTLYPTDESRTIGSTEESKGVIRTTEVTPEELAANKELLEKFPERFVDNTPDTSSEAPLRQAAAQVNDPLLTAIVNDDVETVDNILLDYEPASRVRAVSQALSKLPKDIALNHKDILLPKMKTAIDSTRVRKQKELEGSHKYDAIEWAINETGSDERFQEGVHKETGQKVRIENKLRDFEVNEETGTVDQDDSTDMWEVYVGKQLVTTVKGKVKARRAAESFVNPLSDKGKAKEDQKRSRKGKKINDPNLKAIAEEYEKGRGVNKKQKLADETTTTDKVSSAAEDLPSGEKPATAVEEILVTSTNAKEALLKLIPKFVNRSYGEIARRIIDFLADDVQLIVISPGVKVEGGVPRVMHNSRGVYWQRVGEFEKIILKSSEFDQPGTDEVTFLHEVLHAVLDKQIEKYNSKQYLNTDIGKAIVELYDLQNKVATEINNLIREGKIPEGSYINSNAAKSGIFSVNELVAYGLTDSKFQDILRGISYKGKEALSVFTHLIRRLLRLPLSSQTALDELIRVVDNVLTALPKETVSSIDEAPTTVKTRVNNDNKDKSGKGLLSNQAMKLIEQHGSASAALRALYDLHPDPNKFKELKKELNDFIRNRMVDEVKDKETLTSMFPDVKAALDYVLSKGSATEKVLAQLVYKVTNAAKLNTATIAIDPTIRSASYNPDTHTITIKSNSTKTLIHEIFHALTSRELEVNKEFAKDLEGLRKELLQYVVDNNILTQAQVEYIESCNGSSSLFKERENIIFGGNLDKQNIGYALLNIRELISMAPTENAVTSFLKKVKVEKPKGFVKTLWDKLVSIVGKAFSLNPLQYTALDKIMSYTVGLMEQEKVGKYDVTSEDAKTEDQKREESIAFRDEQLEKIKQREENKDYKGDLLRTYKKVEKHFSKAFQSIYEALANISLPVAQKVRKMEFLINKAVQRRTQASIPFEELYRKKLKKEERDQLDFFLYNYNKDEVIRESLDKFLRDHGMTEAFKKVTTMLSNVYEEAEFFGLNKFTELEYYFPNRVKDYDGLVAYLRKQEDWGMMDEAIKAEENQRKLKNKPALSDREKAEIISDMIRTGRPPGAYLKSPAGLKKRNVVSINADMMKFYYSPTEALGAHIREMTERIEINRMLGITNRQKVISNIRKLYDEITKLKEKKASKDLIEKKLTAMEEEADKLPDMNSELEQGIGRIVEQMVAKRNITSDEQRKVKEFIRARITQVGASKAVSIVRTGALLSSLTQVTTGLRNVTDIIWSAYQSGSMNAIKGIILAATGKGQIKESPFDFHNPLKEFSTLGRFTDKALALSGIMKVDGFMKKATMEASLLRQKEMTPEAFKKKWEKIFEEKTDQVKEDIDNNRMTEDVEYLLWSQVSDFQPVSLSEMPVYFNIGGNARILYLLKSYSIKSANNFHREAVNKIKGGDVKGGIRDLVHLGTLFVLAGATTDWLVDWLNGRSPDFTDSMVDTLLTLGVTSKYTMDKSFREGIVKGHMGNVLPPSGIIDLPFADLVNLLQGNPTLSTMKLLPGFGNMIYNRVTETGQKSIINQAKENLLSEDKPDYADVAALNRKIREFNRQKPEEKIAPITPGTIQKSRDRRKDKNA